jgi:hypothetical protein
VDEHDPTAPAERSVTARDKAQRGKLPGGEKVHSFKTLLDSLKTIVKNENYFPEAPNATFVSTTDPTPQQKQALDLLETIKA